MKKKERRRLRREALAVPQRSRSWWRVIVTGWRALHRASQQPGSVFALGMLLTRNALLVVMTVLAVRTAVVAGHPSSHR